MDPRRRSQRAGGWSQLSVTGEFQRVLGDCLALLETEAPPGGDPWAQALREAAARGSEDLSAGAESVLAARSRLAAQSPRFRSATESARFDSLVDHLARICQVILGR